MSSPQKNLDKSPSISDSEEFDEVERMIHRNAKRPRSPPHAPVEIPAQIETLINGLSLATSCPKCIGNNLIAREDDANGAEVVLLQQATTIMDEMYEVARMKNLLNEYQCEFTSLQEFIEKTEVYIGLLKSAGQPFREIHEDVKKSMEIVQEMFEKKIETFKQLKQRSTEVAVQEPAEITKDKQFNIDTLNKKLAEMQQIYLKYEEENLKLLKNKEDNILKIENQAKIVEKAEARECTVKDGDVCLKHVRSSKDQDLIKAYQAEIKTKEEILCDREAKKQDYLHKLHTTREALRAKKDERDAKKAEFTENEIQVAQQKRHLPAIAAEAQSIAARIAEAENKIEALRDRASILTIDNSTRRRELRRVIAERKDYEDKLKEFHDLKKLAEKVEVLNKAVSVAEIVDISPESFSLPPTGGNKSVTQSDVEVLTPDPPATFKMPTTIPASKEKAMKFFRANHPLVKMPKPIKVERDPFMHTTPSPLNNFKEFMEQKRAGRKISKIMHDEVTP